MLKQQLLSCQESRFTGFLEIKQTKQKDWKIYFCLGRIIWADGGEHQNRFWLNHLNKYCDRPNFQDKNLAEAKKLECCNYRLLMILLEKKKLDQIAFEELVNSQIYLVFFDILQAETEGSLQYFARSNSWDYLLFCGLKKSLKHANMFNVDKLFLQCQKQWEKWCSQGLKNISPNLAPSIKKLAVLRKKVSPNAYENLVKLVNGKRTLRDLAAELNRDLLKLTCSLIPYINAGLIELKPIEDLPLSRAIYEIETKIKTKNKPLVACVDDSDQIILIMKKIVSDLGYNFIGIKEPLRATPQLILANPDLIFLDIGMPDINGYELCAQFRKVSKLKNKPVIMLTGQDGFVDQIKAKVAGCSHFISKPIDLESLEDIINKYLVTKKPKKQQLERGNSSNSKSNFQSLLTNKFDYLLPDSF